MYNFFYYSLLLLVLLAPLRNVVIKTLPYFNYGGFNIINILYLILLIGILIKPKRKEKKEALSSPQSEYQAKLLLPLILFTCYFSLQMIPATSYTDIGSLISNWKDSFIFMLIMYLFVSKFEMDNKRIFMLLIVMCITNTYMDIYFWRWVRWMNFENFADRMKAINGTFADIGGSNEWAAFFSNFTLPIFAVFGTFKKKIVNQLLRGLAICNVFVLMFTFSRGSYLGFVCGALVLLLRKKKYFIIVLLCALPVAYQTILPQSVTQRIEMTSKTNQSGEVTDQDVESRLAMWRVAGQMFISSPLIGHGMGSFRYHGWNNPHNQHLHFLVQGGLIGYLLFVWIFVAAHQDARHLARVAKDDFSKNFAFGCSTMLLSNFIANFFGDRFNYYPLHSYFFTLLGLLIVLIRNSNRQTAELADTPETLPPPYQHRLPPSRRREMMLKPAEGQLDSESVRTTPLLPRGNRDDRTRMPTDSSSATAPRRRTS